jgi:hypothetical protein
MEVKKLWVKTRLAPNGYWLVSLEDSCGRVSQRSISDSEERRFEYRSEHQL